MIKAKQGLDSGTILEYKNKIKLTGKNFITEDNAENTDEYVHFFFIGRHNGEEAVFDSVLYTLRLKYESELHEMAEEKLVAHFPNYEGSLEVDPNSKLEEEMGLMMAEFMMEIEEEEQLKVREEVAIDENFDFGIGLEAALNVQQITPDLIERFVNDFNNNNLQLDPVLYSFQHDEED